MIYLITIFTILFFLLAWWRLDWAVMFLIAALSAYLIRFNIFGLPSTLLEVMIWAVFLSWFIKSRGYIIENLKLSRFARSGVARKINRYPFDWEMTLLLLIALAAAGVAGFNSGSLGIWKAYLFEPVMLFIVVFNIMARKPPYPPLQGGQNSLVRGVELILWPLAVSALAVSIFAVYQKITGQFIDNPAWAVEGARRVVSFFGYPNAVGLYLGPIVLVMIGWLSSVVARSSLFLSSSGERQRDPGIQKGEEKNNLDCSSVPTSGLRKKIVCLRGNDKEEGVAQSGKFKIIFISLTTILSLFAIYFAKSKGALMGVAAGLIVFGLLAGRKVRLATIIFLILIGVGIAFYQPARNLAVENITLTNLSGQIRKAGWSDAWQMLKHGRLITGAGLTNFQTAVAPYHTEGIFFKDPNDPDAQRKLVFNAAYRTAHWQPLEIYLYPHNIILNFWSELGLAGLLLFIWIIGKYFWQGISNLVIAASEPQSRNMNEAKIWIPGQARNDRKEWKFLNIGLICTMVVIIVHGIVDVPYFKNDLAVMFWLFVAMMSLVKLKSIN